jgi:hypothetical protein
VAFWGINTYEVIHAPKTLTGADSRRINNQFCGVIGLSDFETGPFQVMAARPEPLWDSSKGLYLIGGDGSIGRFTGYLHLRYNALDCPLFEFIIVCGRRHVPHDHAPGSGSCRYDYWCTVFAESCEEWASILEGTTMAGEVADVASLDHLDKSFGPRALLTHDHCEVHLPSANFRARISICLRSGTVGDLNAILATIAGEAQCIDIEFSF